MTETGNTPQRVAAGLARISAALRAMAWKRATEEAVTPTQGEILHQLADSDTALRLIEVAEALAISAPTASDAVAALARKGLVNKIAGADRRAVAIRLTSAGKQLAERTRDWPEALAAAAAGLSPVEQGVTLRVLTKLISGLQDRGAISPQRLCMSCRHFRPHVHDNAEAPHHCAFINRAFGDPGLQLNCRDHEAADLTQQGKQKSQFFAGSNT